MSLVTYILCFTELKHCCCNIWDTRVILTTETNLELTN